ncbi:HU family DNA-binding protein [Catellicoccus marimammalium]|uniref:DNA-binding protein HU n=1 Tax=Catellicoccus marimammalium M35/04/3 TaxID=1234409 RepID=K8ZL74_9ENTE|nr:HU family DNA-binding protein [Catellicoccus marimammalium]EKU27323.1 DNA-binding protein HBsu [Catellicoccus marimammalium M35/04/3]
MANKAELIDSVVEKTGLTKKDATEAVDAVFSSIEETLAAGDSVRLIGFGTFALSQRSARKGRNPQTGEPMDIAAAVTPKFKAGKALKDAVKDVQL